MPCKFCGVQWGKDVSDDELSAEIARRAKIREEYFAGKKAQAEAAKQEYLDRVWPAYTLATWLSIANFVVAMFVTAFISGPIGHFARLHLGVFWEAGSLLGVFIVFVLVFSPGISVLVKERRLLANFRKEHPEFYESL
ncbi:MAG: hypothetical protein A3C93_04705 [Candidatus Lloydbacteria bacterium RIFCSPHIGHO2_02_FULL_54_17]|uniref:Uncharacterized protein n=1 Tax=Candidatus Lloydbacteria bacterium RIFCSPHIGHO2_02_FULL_54_17 TaxID=1798664 RepID=A0A1G2DHV3_9BACT|nr:MAG: hypothetical protein A2762_01610 [Candidatus Lloydbacteria bacterium RIFCSPHIGHO2_01_FULL_54_11]OGZ12450.1 MAG: hypothetical protein A3C93_04705 [Candidatus Lloydbacteria bacterium RIFCSPHIGHO2_02_FULL_54_17]OGZ14709.1 MAG: hypothetical protein A2948_04385 [Candidatus Lloydbacteria bacterium RIFCSPLOWO2_01_FULL_54_18]OGZ16736.1 MAG: hypothetical protein A3H76_02285 [Candidatus Lloydbacteria bacterium RIFCSPLOWO2_02_FULL_54_12]